MDVKFDSWNKLLDALRYEYTTSLKDVCKMLKASRDWVNTYVRPNVRSTYLNNNIRAERSTGVNWVRMASIDLEKEMSESVWFHTKDLQAFIRDSVSSVTKQTKAVPVTFFMTCNARNEYTAELHVYDEMIYNTKSIPKRARLFLERDQCYLKYIYDDNATNELLTHRMNVGKRSLAPATPVSLPETPIADWVAPHDIKEYGDADETIYRHFFREGYIRIEVNMPALNGVIGKKIYYVPDPDPITDEGQTLIFSEEAWQHYLRNHVPKELDTL